MSAYLITGDSGSGKTTIIKELSRRGYTAYSTDEMPEITNFYDLATGQKVTYHIPAPIDFSRYGWHWDVPALQKLLSAGPDPVFVGAFTGNSDDNFHLFKNVFALKASAEVLKYRLLTRTTNDFGKHPDELAEMLKYHAISGEYWRSKDAIIIDAGQPVAKVTDDILGYIDKPEPTA